MDFELAARRWQGAEGRGKGFEWSFNCSFGDFEWRPKEAREEESFNNARKKLWKGVVGVGRPEIEESGPGSLHLKLPPAIYFKDQIN